MNTKRLFKIAAFASSVAVLTGVVTFNIGNVIGAPSVVPPGNAISPTFSGLDIQGTIKNTKDAVNTGNLKIEDDLEVSGTISTPKTGYFKDIAASGIINAPGGIITTALDAMTGSGTIMAKNIQASVSMSATSIGVGALNVTGNISNTNGNVTVDDNLDISGNSVVKGTLDVQGSIKNSSGSNFGHLKVDDDFRVGKDLLVTGDLRLSENLILEGATTKSIKTGGSSPLSFDSNASFTKNVSISGFLGGGTNDKIVNIGSLTDPSNLNITKGILSMNGGAISLDSSGSFLQGASVVTLSTPLKDIELISGSSRLLMKKDGNIDTTGTVNIKNLDGKKSSLRLFEGAGYGFDFEYDGALDAFNLWSRKFNGNEAARMTWLKNGNVGIGVTNPTAKLEVNGTATITGAAALNGGATVPVGKSLVVEGSSLFSGDNIFTGSVNLNAGATIPVGKALTVNGNLKTNAYTNQLLAANRKQVWVDDTGYIGWVASSERFKENIKDMEDLSWFYRLHPVNFNYIEDQSNLKQYGLIAEEVEKVNASFITRDKEGRVDGVNYSDLIAPMIKVVQDQKKEIDHLKSENAEIKAALCQIKVDLEVCK